MLAQQLAVPANLEGSFLVNCGFVRADEESLLLQLTAEVTNPYEKKKQGGAKWRKKRHEK